MNFEQGPKFVDEEIDENMRKQAQKVEVAEEVEEKGEAKFVDEEIDEDIRKQVEKEKGEVAKEEMSLSEVASFDELYKSLEDSGGLQGSQEFFKQEDLKYLIEEVRNEKRPIRAITRTGGLRLKVAELLEQDEGVNNLEENKLKLTPENVYAAIGAEKPIEVKVQRSSGEIEDGWVVMGMHPEDNMATVYKFGKENEERTIRKGVSIDELKQWNPKLF